MAERLFFMLAKVIGTRDLDFKASDGKEIKGKQIFVSYHQDGVSGEMVDKIFVNHESPLVDVSYKFGDEYDFVYEIHGFRSKPQLIDIKKDGKSLVSPLSKAF